MDLAMEVAMDVEVDVDVDVAMDVAVKVDVAVEMEVTTLFQLCIIFISTSLLFQLLYWVEHKYDTTLMLS